jgi:glycine/D-amino acid oxidase-like deaminating enzyme
MTGTSLWEHVTDRRDLLRLQPGIPSELDRRHDVLVVGGGVAGLATAVYCRRLGLTRVVLIERASRLARGASAGAGGALLPGLHAMTETQAFAALSRWSFDLYRELDLDWDGAIGVRRTDVLVLDPAEQASKPGLERRYSRRQISPSRNRRSSASAERCEFPTRAMSTRCGLPRPLRDKPGWSPAGSRLYGSAPQASACRLSRRRTVSFHPGAVVLATGLAHTPWVSIPQVRVKGHLLAMDAKAVRLRHGLAAGGLGIGSLTTGELLAGGTHDHGDESPDVDDDVITAIATRVSDLLPGAGSAAITHRYACFRPTTADGQPAIDRLPSLENAWINVGHGGSGILTSAAAGWAVASGIASGSLPENVRDFNIGRFSRVRLGTGSGGSQVEISRAARGRARAREA